MDGAGGNINQSFGEGGAGAQQQAAGAHSSCRQTTWRTGPGPGKGSPSSVFKAELGLPRCAIVASAHTIHAPFRDLYRD